MTNIIHLDQRRPAIVATDVDPLDMYVVRITRTGPVLGEVVGHHALGPEEQRRVAADLIELGRSMLGAAFATDGDADYNVVAEYRVMASGRLTSWTSAQINTAERLDWLRAVVAGLIRAVPSRPNPDGAR